MSLSQSSILDYPHSYLTHYTKTLESLIQSIKFNNYKQALNPLQTKINRALAGTHHNYDAWVPVPYHTIKSRQRGYNIIILLFKHYFDSQNIPMIPMLKRIKQTKPLSQLSKSQRIKTLRGSIQLNTKINLGYSNILLVDDIVTTKTTMKECISILKKQPSIKNITCLSLIKA
tara:strand:+ start:2955 stop:3473 length:519 start_codon:yes stop_codon:yes gene_type:complete